MKTSINLPDSLLERVKEHNRLNPDKEINVSGVTARTLTKILDDYAE